ncbi:hypothetical protein [Holdemanella biformis]|uniref:hypothetical protein n=1 Tax=Holdemanella biformis TaxID=1735 RepID=UPI00266659FE|nr:hypothetical protein [Holdemanella biformis]
MKFEVEQPRFEFPKLSVEHTAKVNSNYLLSFSYGGEHFIIVEYDDDYDILKELSIFSEYIKTMRDELKCFDFACVIPIKSSSGKRIWNIVEKMKNGDKVYSEQLINAIKYAINDQNSPRELIEETISKLNIILSRGDKKSCRK